MAYCVKCGAYIPDGQAVCLACGYDPEAERKAAEEKQSKFSGNAAAQRARAQRADNAELRRRLDAQRQRSQEQSRQWAEQERQRREEQAAREAARRQQQEEDRRWAEEEYQKRQAEQRTRMAYDDETVLRSAGSGSVTGEGNKALAALSYLSVLFVLPYIFMPQDSFARFHAKQGLKLFIAGILADMLGALTGFGWIVTLARLYLIYKGMSNALNGIKLPLPWIGELGEK